MDDTRGFYKLDSGILLFAPNYVLNADYELNAKTKDENKYPVNGWYWFDSEALAREFFGLPPAPEPAPPSPPIFVPR